jgi:hypothetical protein
MNAIPVRASDGEWPGEHAVAAVDALVADHEPVARPVQDVLDRPHQQGDRDQDGPGEGSQRQQPDDGGRSREQPSAARPR